MKIRTIILSALLAVAAIALVSSCTEEPEFTSGDPDVEGCYGVYFPDQNTNLTLDPSDTLALTLSVMRTNTADAITVPYTLKDDYGIFKLEDDITFATGQDSTTVLVTFENADMGTTYTCTITIEDPQYYSVYNSNLPGITISVLRDKWNDLGNCLYTDDFFTTFWSVENLTWEVPIQESDLNPGLYRLEYPYDGKYAYNDSWETDPDDYDYGEADWDTSETYWFTIHAEDPDRVYFDMQPIGVDWGYGMIYVYSMAAYYMDGGYSSDDVYDAGYFGTLKNGYITFPTKALFIYMPGYNETSYYYANTNGKFKIALPGAADYTMEITADECTGGEAPLHFTVGADVDHIRYQIYEGSLKETEVASYAAEIAADTDGEASHLIEAGDIYYDEEVDPAVYVADINVNLGETGIYTVVGVTYSYDEETEESEAQENASCEFCYLAAGDEMPVVAGVDFYSTGKYGYSSDNTLEFCIYGSDLSSVKYSIVRTNDYLADPESVQYDVKNVSLGVDDDVLEEINASGGYTAYGTGYTAGTEYTIVVWASNGYESTFLTATAKTTGVFVPTLESLLGIYSVTETSYWYGTYTGVEWDFEACDEDDEEGYDFKLTVFDDWPCETPIYGTIDLENATFTIPDWQYFLTYSGYDLYFSTNSLDAATFSLTGDGSFTGADDIFGVYLCTATSYLGWNDAYTAVSGLRVSTAASEESIKPSSVNNLSPVGRKGTLTVDPYARFIQSDSREVQAVSFTATPAQAKVSTSTFVKGSAPAKAHKAVTSLK